uniref:C2H2-type domain-containing protein n=1 Tax=Glossina brevipalpis TaxID=37001 RepID=A0A1A9WGZ6_9MUSC
MQNWGEAMPNPANYMEHNTWYYNMFAANIKTEPDYLSPSSGSSSNNNSVNNNINNNINNNHKANTNHLETYLKHQVQQQPTSLDTLNTMTLSPHHHHNEQFFHGSLLTPRHTPPMDITPPKSPKLPSSLVEVQISEKEELMSNSSEDLRANGGLTYDENLRLKRYKHGKLKTYTCKTCNHVSTTKWEEYEHMRTHEDGEKIFPCPKCPFFARVKHHLEKFHLIKHENIKPYKCEECDYSCENASMLTSHQKKHSPVYPYQCGDCRFVSKFCNPFKKHLRKTRHQVYKILDENGIPIPSKFIDVYGSKRGPKNSSSSRSRGSFKRLNGGLKLPNSSQLSANLQDYALNSSQIPTSPTKSSSSLNSNNNNNNNSASEEPGPQLLPHLDTLLQLEYFKLLAQQQASALVQQQHSPSLREQREPLTPPEEDEMEDEEEEDDDDEEEEDDDDHEEDDDNKTEKTDGEDEDKAPETTEIEQNVNVTKLGEAAMDLSQSNAPHKIIEGETSSEQTPEIVHNPKLPTEIEETPFYPCSGAAKRKGRVLRLEQEQTKTNLLSTKEEYMEVEHDAATPSENTVYECKYCETSFKDSVLHTIHMGFHSRDDPFKCNLCGEKCDGAVALTVHLARKEHSPLGLALYVMILMNNCGQKKGEKEINGIFFLYILPIETKVEIVNKGQNIY